MSEQVGVTIGAQTVNIVIEGGSLSLGMSIGQAELNQAVAESRDAANDAEAAAQAANNAMAFKADISGANVANADAIAFARALRLIGADGTTVSTFDERHDRDPVDLVTDYGADPTGVVNASPALRDAVIKCLQTGRPLRAIGRFRYNDPIVIESRDFNPNAVPGFLAFCPGLRIYGPSGPLSTVFRSFVNGPLISYGVDVNPFFTITATSSNGSPTLTGIADTSEIEIGALIEGTGVKGNVLSKTASTVTLNANATNSATGSFTVAIFRAMLGCELENISFVADSSTSGSSGITVQSQFYLTARRCIFSGFKSDGVKLICNFGDLDGPAYTRFEDCLFHNCLRWGVDALGAAGRNEISYARFINCWWQGNGTTETYQPNITPGVNEPTSGGIRLKTQSTTIMGGGFTLNKNIGLLFQGGSGLGASLVVGEGVSFENNIDRASLITGCHDARFSDVHLYSNVDFQTRRGFETVGTVYTIGNVIYDNMRVRVAAGVTCTAFRNTPISASSSFVGVEMRSCVWQEFGGAGQVALEGTWKFGPFELASSFSFAGGVATILEGSKFPWCKRDGGGRTFESGYFEQYMNRVPVSSADNTGIPNGIYNLYVSDTGSLINLNVSVAAPVLRYGVKVRGGMEGQIWVGRCEMTGSGFRSGAAANYLNPGFIHGYGYQWVDSGGVVRRNTALPTSDTDGTAV